MKASIYVKTLGSKPDSLGVMVSEGDKLCECKLRVIDEDNKSITVIVDPLDLKQACDLILEVNEYNGLEP